jgi:phosphohistidine phosphatase
MKRLTLVRHAKSDWSLPDQNDWDRPLNRRGQRDAPLPSRPSASTTLRAYTVSSPFGPVRVTCRQAASAPIMGRRSVRAVAFSTGTPVMRRTHSK